MKLLVLKIPMVIVPMTLFTWGSIYDFWGNLYATGAVPYYYAGSMALMRPALHAPLQLVVLVGVAVLVRRRLLRVPWVVMLMPGPIMWPVAGELEAFAWTRFDTGSQSLAHFLWDVGPHISSGGVLLLTAFVVSAPDQPQQPTALCAAAERRSRLAGRAANNGRS